MYCLAGQNGHFRSQIVVSQSLSLFFAQPNAPRILYDRSVCAFRTHSSACFVTGEFVKLPTITTTTTMMMTMMTNLPPFTLPCFFLSLSSWYLLATRVWRNLELPSPCKPMSLGSGKRGSIGTGSVSKLFAHWLSENVLQSTQLHKLKQEGTIVRFSSNTKKMPSTLCFPIVNLFIWKNRRAVGVVYYTCTMASYYLVSPWH